MAKANKKFSWKVFISFGLTYSFIIIFLTGIVLYLAPAGRIAHWVDWKFIIFTKDEWQAIHMNFSYLFVILSIFHLFTINWKAFLSYLKSKNQSGLNKKCEFIISSFLTIAIFFAIIFSVPPFSLVVDFGEYLTESWENEKTQPPIPHAELLSLSELAEQLDNMPIGKIESKLLSNKIIYDNIRQTLEEIAILNNITPSELYKIITKKSQARSLGSGMGRKTLEGLALENNKDVDNFIQLLNENNIVATKDQTLKNLADKYDMAVRDIYQLILEEK